MTDLSLLDAALRDAACGWQVFPCHTPTGAGCSCRRACGRMGKHPRTRNGLKDATTNATTISRWWKQWPQANIAVATGAVSGLVVLDEDTYKGGDTSRMELERIYQPFPETVQQLTGGGGVQFFFAHPGTHVKNGVETLGVGLDIRGDGGYVIVPPSLHVSGKRYAWELSHHPDETPLAPMPVWLLALCQDTTRREAPSAGDPIPQGRRNQTLFQLGCSLRARGCTKAVILAALRAMNATQCQPPLDTAEVATIAASCAQYSAGPTREDTHQRTSAVPGKDGTQAPANGLVLTGKQVIRITHEMTTVADALQQAILALPDAPQLFQRAHQLCIIARGITPPKWLQRPLEAPVIVPADSAYLRELATVAATWHKYDKRARRWEPTLPPVWAIETLLARPSWPFPMLEGVICAPTLRPDGSILATPGYDADTGLYLDLNGTEYPPIRERPTLDDARTAIGMLQQVFIDFPFTAPHHFSTALAAVLSLVCRFTIQSNVPLFAVRSTTRGSGKGLLIDAISVIATGRQAPRWAQTREEEEERKRLLTLALAGDTVVHIDNVSHTLGSAPLDLAITAPTVSDRILGKHASREAPLHAVFFASGNNMTFRGDTTRRVVPIDLDPQMEHPEERDNFTHSPLLPWVHKDRPRLVIATLTVLKAYFMAGCPAQGIKPLGSFEQWSTLVRQALIWAGEADPCEGRKDIEAESDPDFEAFRQLLACWSACYATEHAGVTLKRALQDALHLGEQDPHKPGNAYDELRDALGTFDPRYDGKTLHSDAISYRLRGWKGRVIDGQRLVKAGEDHKVTKWRVETL